MNEKDISDSGGGGREPQIIKYNRSRIGDKL